jgi:hypothetical protein
MATAATAARHICLSVSRFRDLIGEGVFKRMPAGKYDLRVIRETYCRHMQKIAAGRAADGGAALSTQRSRLASAQAARMEFEVSREMGNFVSLPVIKDMLISTFSTIREVALGTAGKISDGLQAFTPLDREAIFKVINGEIIAMLEELSDPDGLACQAADASAKTKGTRS